MKTRRSGGISSRAHMGKVKFQEQQIHMLQPYAPARAYGLKILPRANLI